MNTSDAPVRAPPAIPVAEYVRMSTDLQIYSPANQSAAIEAYADAHGMQVVRTYLDEGRSGLDLGGRHALQRLLRDVRSGHAEYEAVLVYDVSRWGRFQNSDEAAYYEYLCTRAGIRVFYVAEPFENDGSPLTTILKGLKRAMAAEFSRELSEKVFAGQSRLARLGFRQGASAGYGMQRFLVDSMGREKGPLQKGERKSITSDRILLVPGDPREVAIVKLIFEQYVAGSSTADLAETLNACGVRTSTGKRWTRCTIREVLMNEKYIGNNIFGRYSRKLRQPGVFNPENEWARKDAAFPALVSPHTFRCAQEILTRRTRRPSDEDLLAPIRTIFAREGIVTQQLIENEPECPSAKTYMRHFGSLRRLYAIVGAKPAHNLNYADVRLKTKGWRETITAFIGEDLAEQGSIVVRDGWAIRVDDAWTMAVSVLLASHHAKGRRWFIRRLPEEVDVVVIARMGLAGEGPLDYLILPRIAYAKWPLNLYETNGPALEAYTFPSLAVLRELALASSGGSTSCG